jgi:hypothetical protein
MCRAPPLPIISFEKPFVTVSEFIVTLDDDEIKKQRTRDLPLILNPLPFITIPITPLINTILVRSMSQPTLIVVFEIIAINKAACVYTVVP